MKLTTLKVSVPVLMLMLFQSGYGVSDWFEKASIALNSGNRAEAFAIVQEVHPEKVGTLSEADKEKFQEEWEKDVREKVDSIAPRYLVDGEELTPRTAWINSVIENDLEDPFPTKSYEVKGALFFRILADAASAGKQLKTDGYWLDVGNNVNNNPITKTLADVIATTSVPGTRQNVEDVGDINAEFLGQTGDQATKGTLYGFLENYQGEDSETAFSSIATERDLIGLYVSSNFTLAHLTEIVNTEEGDDNKLIALNNAIVNIANTVRNTAYEEAGLVIGDNGAITTTEKTAIETAVAEADIATRVSIFNDSLVEMIAEKTSESAGSTEEMVKAYLLAGLNRKLSEGIVGNIVETVEEGEATIKEACIENVGDTIESWIRNDEKYSEDYEDFITGLDNKVIYLYNAKGITDLTDVTEEEDKAAVLGALVDYVQTFDDDTADTVFSLLKAIEKTEPNPGD